MRLWQRAEIEVCMSFLYLQLALKGLDQCCLWFKGIMQEFRSKKGRNGGTGQLEMVVVTGDSFHIGKVNGCTCQSWGGKDFIP